MCGLLFQMI